MKQRFCTECGNAFQSRQYNAEFCGTECRRTFNNRRATRGAALYDLLMIEKVDPTAFQSFGLDGRADALLRSFIKEDKNAKRKRTTKRANEVHYDTVKLSAL